MGLQGPFFPALNIRRNIGLNDVILDGVTFRPMKSQADEIEWNDAGKSLQPDPVTDWSGPGGQRLIRRPPTERGNADFGLRKQTEAVHP